MALQKKNDLLRSHVVVLSFWYLVFFFVSEGLNLRLLADSLSYSLMVVFGGLLCGVVTWVGWDLSRKHGILSNIRRRSVRGMTISIGGIPEADAPASMRPRESRFSSRFPWWKAYKRKHPEHSAAMLALLGVMEAKKDLPASPVPGGHGGATLIEHSLNVVDTMMTMAPSWVYKGHRNKRGEVIFPLLDNTRAEFRFDPDDPILPLAAFAHDIGKLRCYQQRPDGSVTEVRKNHDIEGARLLRCVPEVMGLPWKERVALLTAVEYYHHIGSLPYSTWIDDRARALIELLIAADIATGQKEGGVVVSEYEDIEAHPAPQASASAPAATACASPVQAHEEDDAGERVADAAEALPHVASMHAQEEDANPDIEPPDAEPAPMSARPEHGTALDLAYSVLLEPGRVNGTNASTRVAWKHGQWLYISDAKLRAAVANMTGDSSYNALPHRGTMHAFTLELMAQLAASGNLLQEHDGLRFSEKRAIFTTVSSVAGKTPVETRFVIVANVRAFPGLERAADCRAAPKIVGCSWGSGAAINKAASSRTTKSAAGEDGLRVDHDDGGSPSSDDRVVDVAEFLLDAAAQMRIPSVRKTVDGVDYVLIDEEVVKSEYPDLPLDDERIVRRTGGKSGITYLCLKP